MREYLSAKAFCEIVRDSKRKIPKKVTVRKRNITHLTLIWGWIGSIQSSSPTKAFNDTNPVFLKQIKKLKITEEELLYLLAIKSIDDARPNDLHASKDDELYPKAK